MRLRYYTQDQDRSWYKPFVCETLHVERKDPLAGQIAHFAAVIRGEAEPLVSARDGLQNLRVTEAVVERRGPARWSGRFDAMAVC